MAGKYRPPRSTNADPSIYRRLRLKPRSSALGAWIDGVDLAKPVDAETAAELKRAWLDWGVIFFRDQEALSPEAHARVAGIFGSVYGEGNPQLSRGGANAEVEYLTADAVRKPYADTWHTDITWKKDPPIGTMIQIQELPPVGGNTTWLCTRTAYEWMSPAMQRGLEKLTAIHTWNHGRFRLYEDGGERLRRMEAAGFPPVEHPVIRVHPLTGRKSIYVNETFTDHIRDMHVAESKAILEMIFEWLHLPEFQVHHQWEKNGVAIWDNYRTQHYALADYFPANRRNQRLCFGLAQEDRREKIAA